MDLTGLVILGSRNLHPFCSGFRGFQHHSKAVLLNVALPCLYTIETNSLLVLLLACVFRSQQLVRVSVCVCVFEGVAFVRSHRFALFLLLLVVVLVLLLVVGSRAFRAEQAILQHSPGKLAIGMQSTHGSARHMTSCAPSSVRF